MSLLQCIERKRNTLFQKSIYYHDKTDERDWVEGAIPEERPPGEVEDRFGEEGAHSDDEEDVEDRGADDGADADVRERDEDPDDRGE